MPLDLGAQELDADPQFAFYTGYTVAPDGWGHVPIISKPASGKKVVETVERLCGSYPGSVGRESKAAH
jgi:hypothetical protein